MKAPGARRGYARMRAVSENMNTRVKILSTAVSFKKTKKKQKSPLKQSAIFADHKIL